LTPQGVGAYFSGSAIRLGAALQNGFVSKWRLLNIKEKMASFNDFFVVPIAIQASGAKPQAAA
jgi:hypothetical protein